MLQHSFEIITLVKAFIIYNSWIKKVKVQGSYKNKKRETKECSYPYLRFS